MWSFDPSFSDSVLRSARCLHLPQQCQIQRQCRQCRQCRQLRVLAAVSGFFSSAQCSRAKQPLVVRVDLIRTCRCGQHQVKIKSTICCIPTKRIILNYTWAFLRWQNDQNKPFFIDMDHYEKWKGSTGRKGRKGLEFESDSLDWSTTCSNQPQSRLLGIFTVFKLFISPMEQLKAMLLGPRYLAMMTRKESPRRTATTPMQIWLNRYTVCSNRLKPIWYRWNMLKTLTMEMGGPEHELQFLECFYLNAPAIRNLGSTFIIHYNTTILG